MQQSDLIVVSCEQAPHNHFGDNGMVLSVSGNKVTYLPERTGGATTVTVPLHMALQVPAWPNRAPPSKALNWLSQNEVETIWEHWNFLPLEDDELAKEKLLDHTDLEVGCLELLWRVLPPYTLVLPVQLPPMLRHPPDPRGGDAATTLSSFVNQLHAFAERARCLLCPIYQSDHFTLLVLERWGDVDNKDDGKLPAQLARYGQRQTNTRKKRRRFSTS